MLRGRAIRLGDNISTDLIVPGRYTHLRSNLPELSKHAFEDALPDFRDRVQPGDVVVAGDNFGLGSSREAAAHVIKLNGISAVVANSFARIFFRNAINIGLPVVIADSGAINDGDALEIDLVVGLVHNVTTGAKMSTSKLPEIMLRILQEGGLVAYVKKYGDLAT